MGAIETCHVDKPHWKTDLCACACFTYALVGDLASLTIDLAPGEPPPCGLVSRCTVFTLLSAPAPAFIPPSNPVFCKKFHLAWRTRK